MTRAESRAGHHAAGTVEVIRPVGRNVVRRQLHAAPPLSSGVDDAAPSGGISGARSEMLICGRFRSGSDGKHAAPTFSNIQQGDSK
jgi:hypothetical protein